MLKRQVRKEIEEVLKNESLPTAELLVEESKFGDFSTNIALKLKKPKNYHRPLEVAKLLVSKLKENDLFSQVSVALPGFINLTLNPKKITSLIQKITEEGDKWGSSSENKGKKAQVEFVSANPTGPLHIGNARGGPLGDSLANILDFTGYTTTRQFYDNNIGTQVDIFISSLIHITKSRFETVPTKEQAGQEQLYSGEYLEDLTSEIINQLNISEVDQIDQNQQKIRHFALKTLFEEIIITCEKMRVSFNQVIHESTLQEEGKTGEVIKTLIDSGYTKEKEGAVWFFAGKDSLDDRESVLVRADKRPTYFADDLAYHKLKFKLNPDLVVNILGSNHHGHVGRLTKGVQALGFNIDKFKFILYQFVRVKKRDEILKMSKRAGNFITAAEVLDEVGADSFRFFLLSHSPNAHIDFDIELAKKENEENPVYYIQYAHARLSSILEKAPTTKISKVNYGLLDSPEELELIRKILTFPDLVVEVSENFAIHHLASYAVEVADLFHSFYEKQRVISEKPDLTAARLELIKGVKITLSNCLKLLGISAPDRM